MNMPCRMGARGGGEGGSVEGMWIWRSKNPIAIFIFFWIGNKTCIKETQSAQIVHPRKQHYNKEILTTKASAPDKCITKPNLFYIS